MPLIKQRKLFLSTMFDPDDIVWVGDEFESGPKYAHLNKFRKVKMWTGLDCISGEFVSHATFKEGTTSRDIASVEQRMYLVLESDKLRPVHLSSVAQYLISHYEMKLRAIVTTGGRRFHPDPGLHFWFAWDDYDADEIGAVLQGYNCDPATLRASQPVRLPGCVRKNTGLRQELLWIG